MAVTEMKPKQVIEEDVLENLEAMIREARAGKITELVCVWNDASDGAFYRVSQFSDAWRLLGAIEYARQTVHRGM